MTTPYQRSRLAAIHPAEIAPRFWPKVRIQQEDECWEWTAFHNRPGYGMFRIAGKMELAHRVSWVLHHGPFVDGAQVLHRCDNPPCVNPSHLFLGDNAANVADKVAKGRSHAPQPKKRGEGHPLAKLTWEDVRFIRRSWTGEVGQGRRLATQFNVSPATITNVLKRKVWRDEVSDPRPGVGSPSPGGPTHGVSRGGH